MSIEESNNDHCRDFVIGTCYFILSYYDNDMRIPLIDTYIYVDLNILENSDQNEEDFWYFQDPDSYNEQGHYSTAKVKSSITLTCVARESLEMLIDVQEVIRRLERLKR